MKRKVIHIDDVVNVDWLHHAERERRLKRERLARKRKAKAKKGVAK